MKSIFKYSIPAVIVCALAACGGGNHDHSEESTSAVASDNEQKCVYNLIEDSTKVNWLAYKTTEKIGVGGTFDIAKISTTPNAASLMALFADAKFKIQVASINSNNPERDKKLTEFFFGTMDATSILSGHVVSMTESSAVVAITMNGITNNQEMQLTTDNESTISMTGVLDLTKWSAEQSIKALNEVCFDLHKGKDGVSKLWPEVKIDVACQVAKKCE